MGKKKDIKAIKEVLNDGFEKELHKEIAKHPRIIVVSNTDKMDIDSKEWDEMTNRLVENNLWFMPSPYWKVFQYNKETEMYEELK